MATVRHGYAMRPVRNGSGTSVTVWTGLATHNYESTYRALPPVLLRLSFQDPDPNAKFAGSNISAAYLTLLLPFIEQDPLYRLIDVRKSMFNTVNIPPNGPHSGANRAYATVVNTYICPSSPAPSTIDYYNTCWGPYGNGGGQTGRALATDCVTSRRAIETNVPARDLSTVEAERCAGTGGECKDCPFRNRTGDRVERYSSV